MSNEDVLAASEQFYEALTRLVNGEPDPMTRIWSHTDEVSIMHPIGGRQHGWSAVAKSWTRVAQIASEGHVEMVDRVIQVFGDVAFETGVEQGRSRLAGQQITFEHRVTNIYRREGAEWKIVHHHADVSPTIVDVVGEAGETD